MWASRQTELQREFPIHVACSWLGNAPRIALQSYLLVSEVDFAKATGFDVASFAFSAEVSIRSIVCRPFRACLSIGLATVAYQPRLGVYRPFRPYRCGRRAWEYTDSALGVSKLS